MTASFFPQIFYSKKTSLDLTEHGSYNPLYSLNFFQVIFLILIFIALFFIQILFSSSLVYYSLYKKDNKSLSFKEILSGGKKYFWKFLGLYILIFFIIVVMLPYKIISLIIPSLSLILTLILICNLIYFSIKWIFSPFVLIGENKGIIESLKISSSMVKKRWWITFFYVFFVFYYFNGNIHDYFLNFIYYVYYF
ncbi:MAG: hypothetical protein QXW97_04405 [Candidatus Pacearchaeota archaeon]